MATLNVRERRIEAKIAYVGPELAGKTTNFQHLSRLGQGGRDPRIGWIEPARSANGDQMSLAWRPLESERFRDCDVAVTLVAMRGGLSEPRSRDALVEVDGVVLVIDAHPAAQERNRLSMMAVRDALGQSSRGRVPVVVQVNKTDLPDALPVAEVVANIDGGSLRHVSAAATRGDGVIETLQVVFGEVLASLEGRRSEGEIPRSEEGGHPLLTALRQVLRATVREHVAELEQRIYARIEARLGPRLDAIEGLVREVDSKMNNRSKTGWSS